MEEIKKNEEGKDKKFCEMVLSILSFALAMIIVIMVMRMIG